MSSVMLALGGYRFSINTAALQSLDRTSNWRWQAQARAGAKPMQQFIGPDVDTITLQGVILPHYKGGLGQVDTMRQQADTGKPLLLTDGSGGVHGQWVITGLNESRKILMDNGQPRAIEFSLQIRQYGDDNATVSN